MDINTVPLTGAGTIGGAISTSLIRLPQMGQTISQIGTGSDPATKGGFWNILGGIVSGGADILTGKRTIDLSKSIKLPTVDVQAGVKSDSIMRIGLIAIVSIIILKILKIF